MKKILSAVLAFVLVLSLASGTVIFTASADRPFYADYEFTQLPGIQDWGETELTAYNTQAALAKSDSGTPGELVATHTKGTATQALKLAACGKPNAWSYTFTTSGNASDQTAASQIGNIFGSYGVTSVLAQYDGIRIGVVNEFGENMSFDTSNKNSSQLVKCKIIGSAANSWNNKSVPFAESVRYFRYVPANTVTDPDEKARLTAENENTLVYADGYVYLYFSAFYSGWDKTKNFFDLYGTKDRAYGNIHLTFQTSGINSTSYNGGAIYISDMQLFKEAEPLDFDALNDLICQVDAIDADGRYAEALAAARAAAANPDVSRSEFNAAKEALESVNGDLIVTLNSLLDDADMCGYFNESSPYYGLAADCDILVNTPDHTLKEYADAVLALKAAIADGNMGEELFSLVQKANSLWIYNYTEDSYYTARKTAMSVLNAYDDNDEELLPAMRAVIDALVPAKVYRTGTGTLFDGWTTDDVNDLVNLNSAKLCDSIGDGLNTNGVYNSGDFTNDTAFAAGDGWFSMTAEADFAGASIGWKNMDRDGTLAGSRNAGFPVFGDVDFANADGIRFRIEVSGGGHAGRVLIGLSNCKDVTLEGYALKVPVTAADENGYINIPFTYFENAWWTTTDFVANRDKFIVFICEAYDVAKDTTLKFSDMTTFTYTETHLAATQAQLAALQDIIKVFEATDLGDGRLANLAAAAGDAAGSNDFETCLEALNALAPVADAYKSVKRDALKEKIGIVAALDTEGYFAEEMHAVTDTYYNTDSSAEDIAQAEELCDEYAQRLTAPDAPDTPVLSKVTHNSVTLRMGAKKIQFRMGEDGEWSSANVFEELEPDTEYTFYARIMPSGPTPASAPSKPLAVRTEKTPMEGNIYIEGNPAYGNTLVTHAELTYKDHGVISYIWYRVSASAENTDVQIGTGTGYTVTAEDIGYVLYVTATAENCSGELVSDSTAVVAKGTPAVTKAPEGVTVISGDALATAKITGAEVSVEGVWSWKNPEIVPQIAQSGMTFTAVFTPQENSLYESVEAEVTVTVLPNTVIRTVTDERTGVSFTGEFYVKAGDPVLRVADILPAHAAYADLLRSSRETDNSLILLKTFGITGDLSESYTGTLTMKAYLDKSRANETYTLYMFGDGEVRSREVTVDSEGYITVEGLQIAFGAAIS